MPDPTTDPIGSYWANGSGGSTALSAADLNARETVIGAALILPFSSPGSLVVQIGRGRFRMPVNAKLLNVAATVGTPPIGNAIKVDVNRNRISVFTTQANRPTIADGDNTSGAATPDVTAFAAGDIVSVDVDEIGSTAAGSDLVVTMSFQGATTGPSLAYADVIGNTPGLVSYWKLDETSGTAMSDSVYGNHGNYENTPTLNVSPLVPNSGKAVTFVRASSESVSISDSTSLKGANDWSVEAWAKPASQPSAGQFYTIIAKAQTLESITWGMDYRDTGGTKQLVYSLRTGGSTTEHVVTQTLTTGTTYHLVGTWDGAVLKLYVNGSIIGTSTALTGQMVSTTAGVRIAAYDNLTPSDFFDGTLDEVAVYNVALPAATILAHYNKGLTG